MYDFGIRDGLMMMTMMGATHTRLGYSSSIFGLSLLVYTLDF